MWLNNNKMLREPEDGSVRSEIWDKHSITNSVQDSMYPHDRSHVGLSHGLVCKGYGFNQFGLINYLNEQIVI